METEIEGMKRRLKLELDEAEAREDRLVQNLGDCNRQTQAVESEAMRRQEELGGFLTIFKADLEDARIEEVQGRTSDLESANEQLVQERGFLKT